MISISEWLLLTVAAAILLWVIFFTLILFFPFPGTANVGRRGDPTPDRRE